MTLERTDELVAEGVERLLAQFEDKGKLAAFLSAFLAEAQQIEDATWELLLERSLDTAVGAQLDVIGRIVGLERLDTDDEIYRSRLRAQIAINRSSGTPEDVLRVVHAMADPAGARVILDELPPAGYHVELVDVPIQPAIYGEALGKADPLGVHGVLITQAVEDAGLFTFATGSIDGSSAPASATQGFLVTEAGLAFTAAAYKTFGTGHAVLVADGVSVHLDNTGAQTEVLSGEPIRDVVYSSWQDLFVSVGDGGAIFTSPTGAVWTARSSGTSENLRTIGKTGNGQRFFAAGDNGTILESTDGIAWTPVVSPLGTAVNYISCAGQSTVVLLLTEGTSVAQYQISGAVWTTQAVPSGTRRVKEINNSLWLLTDTTAVYEYFLGGAADPYDAPEPLLDGTYNPSNFRLAFAGASGVWSGPTPDLLTDLVGPPNASAVIAHDDLGDYFVGGTGYVARVDPATGTESSTPYTATGEFGGGYFRDARLI